MPTFASPLNRCGSDKAAPTNSQDSAAIGQCQGRHENGCMWRRYAHYYRKSEAYTAREIPSGGYVTDLRVWTTPIFAFALWPENACYFTRKRHNMRNDG